MFLSGVASVCMCERESEGGEEAYACAHACPMATVMYAYCVLLERRPTVLTFV